MIRCHAEYDDKFQCQLEPNHEGSHQYTIEWEDEDKGYAPVPVSMVCSMCKQPCLTYNAHLHQGEYIGDECCWDERLRTTE